MKVHYHLRISNGKPVEDSDVPSITKEAIVGEMIRMKGTSQQPMK